MKILTANRLTDGEAVWYGASQAWIETIDGSEIANDAAAEQALEAIGQAAFRANFVVDLALVDIQLVDGAIVPVRLRERIRANGPTNRNDLGKQARAAKAA